MPNLSMSTLNQAFDRWSPGNVRVGAQYTIHMVRRAFKAGFAARAALDSTPVWQPMDSAPKDGTRVIVKIRHGLSAHIVFAKYGRVGWGSKEAWYLCDKEPRGEDDHECIKPIGWMPLPPV